MLLDPDDIRTPSPLPKPDEFVGPSALATTRHHCGGTDDLRARVYTSTPSASAHMGQANDLRDFDPSEVDRSLTTEALPGEPELAPRGWRPAVSNLLLSTARLRNTGIGGWRRARSRGECRRRLPAAVPTMLVLTSWMTVLNACENKHSPHAATSTTSTATKSPPCLEGTDQQGHTRCGLRGHYRQVCVAGAWVDQDICDEPWLIWTDRGKFADHRGAAVSLSGRTLVVAGEHELHVYTRVEKSWNRQTTLSVSGVADFGVYHAVHGDTLAATGGDFVYVFERSGNEWLRQARMALAVTEYTRHRHSSIALSEDTLVVGTPLADGGDGVVQVFTRSAGQWLQQIELRPNDNFGRSFGESVAVDGPTLIVGIGHDSEKGVVAGAASVFEREGEQWRSRGKIFGSDTARLDRFGTAVAVANDVAVLGAKYRSETGAAYVFERSEGVWKQTAKLLASEPMPNAAFGASVAVSSGMIVLGAPAEFESYRSALRPSVYLFTRHDGEWSEQNQFSLEFAGGYFGQHVALSDHQLVVGGWLSTAALDLRSTK